MIGWIFLGIVVFFVLSIVFVYNRLVWAWAIASSGGGDATRGPAGAPARCEACAGRGAPSLRAQIPVRASDGRTLPAETGSYDAATLVDVLHHAEDPRHLLAEAARVARLAVVVKDHYREGLLAGPVLRLMDWVGNAHHGVDLRYDYWTESERETAFREAGLAPTERRRHLGLYALPARLVFERRLHFAARLEPSRRS